MALNFGLDTQQYKILHDTLGTWSADNFTCFAIIRDPDVTTVEIHMLMQKIDEGVSNSQLYFALRAGEIYILHMETASSDRSRYLSSDLGMSADTWYFIAGRVHAGNGTQMVFAADLLTADTPTKSAASLVSQDLATPGDDDFDGGNLYIGTMADGNNEAGEGDIALYGIYEGDLTDAEITKLFRHIKSRWGVPKHFSSHTLKLWCLPGLHGDSTVVDLSGQGHNGTCDAEITLADSPPLGSPFGFGPPLPMMAHPDTGAWAVDLGGV